MATEIKYNGNPIASITRGQIARIACENKLMIGDMEIESGTGVHVGSDTPPDSVNVWIDPNGKPTSVEKWDFDLDDGTTEAKTVVVLDSDDATEGKKAGILRLRQADGTWIEIPAIIGDQGPQGDRGETGVYIGTDTPPETSNVWINPDGDPTSTEDWEFDLEDETTETKTVVVLGSDEASASGKLAILKLKQPDGSWLEIPGLKGNKGDKGDPGSIDNLSSAAIREALGYTPASDTSVNQLSEEIDDLENTYDIAIGKNLYDKSKTIKGCYLDENGNSVANARFNLTDYIPVTNRYIISSCLVNGARSIVPSYFLTEYDSEKNKINYIASKSRITLNENTRYIRFSVDTVHDNEYMTEYGDYFSEYEPYTKKYILKPQSLPAVDQRKWFGLKWTCIGDSLTENNDKTTKHYFDYISEKTGISVQNLGVSGSGYARKQDTNQAFFQQILLTDADTDVVTIFGSFNDSSADLPYGSIDDNGTDTYYGCVNKAIDNLYSILPTVQLGIIAPTPWESVNPFTREDVENNYVKMLENVCRKRGIPFLDLYHTSGLRPWDENFKTLAYSKDNGYGVHPDETGHKIFAPRVQKFLDELLLH